MEARTTLINPGVHDWATELKTSLDLGGHGLDEAFRLHSKRFDGVQSCIGGRESWSLMLYGNSSCT